MNASGHICRLRTPAEICAPKGTGDKARAKGGCTKLSAIAFSARSPQPLRSNLKGAVGEVVGMFLHWLHDDQGSMSDDWRMEG